MGYDFKSSAAAKIFSSLPPSLGADAAFLEMAVRGGIPMKDWCENLVRKIEFTIMSMEFEAKDLEVFDVAKDLFVARIGDAYWRLLENNVSFLKDQDAGAVSDACRKLVDSCEQLVAQRHKEIEEWRKPYLRPLFDDKVKLLREHETSVWRAGQGIAVIAESAATGKPLDARLLREMVAPWEPPVRAGGPGVGLTAGGHRAPPSGGRSVGGVGGEQGGEGGGPGNADPPGGGLVEPPEPPVEPPVERIIE